MKLPEPYKTKLLDEFDYVLQKLSDERRPDEKTRAKRRRTKTEKKTAEE